MPAKSRKLAQGLLHQWGFHFSYSTIRGTGPRKLPPTSQDLALALELFNANVASVEPKDRATIADRYYQALLLTRTVVLYQFLESLPHDLSADQVRKEWLYFQLSPPRTSPDTDIFASVFQALVAGSRENLRSCARSWMCSTTWRRFRWFPKSFLVFDYSGTPIPSVNDGKQPPFYVVVDEVVPSTIDDARLHSRRATRRRKAVCELFWPESFS